MAEEFASKASVERLYNRLERVENELSDFRKIATDAHSELNRRISIQEKTAETLPQITQALQSVEISLAKVTESLKSLEKQTERSYQKIDSIEADFDKKILDISATIENQEKRGTIDFIGWLSENWVMIAIAVLLLTNNITELFN